MTRPRNVIGASPAGAGFTRDRQPQSITSTPARGRTVAVAAMMAALLSLSAVQPLARANEPSQAGPWREEPRYVPLLASADGRTVYHAYVSSRPLDSVLAALATDTSLLHPPGAWSAESLSAADAFGLSGSYNRWTLSLLYGGTFVRVARGPRGDGARIVESWRLISPFPDPTLRQLERGTLLLVETVTPL